MAKKKRTPAQIRATKKLIAFNKRRRALKRKTNPKVKRKVKRKVAKKRTVKRKVAKRSSPRKLYYIMVKNKRTGRKGYYSGNSFSTSSTKALLSQSKSEMVKLAKKVRINRSQWDVYVGAK